MAFAEVPNGKASEECSEVSAASNQSFTSEDKSFLANSSFENSPLLDKEKILRYSARSRDEFWDALSSNYDYLMDDGLIASCREASSDLSLDDENEIPEFCYWSFTQFIEQFKWLHDLLHNLQVAKEGENKRSDSKIVEEQQKIAYLCKLFNDQAQKLSKRYPDLRDEVIRHLNRLNNKWKAVEQSINPNKVKSPSKSCVFNEITNRMRTLRKWLRDIEHRLIPMNLATNWSLESLEKRYKEQQELQKEIESQGKYVSSLLKLCEHLKGNVRFGQNSLMIWDAERVRKVALNLEHRWHTLWIKSLECHCILEDLIQNCAKHSDKLDKSFSEEPLKKHPRLSGACEELLLLENELRDKMSCKVDDEITADENLLCCDHTQQTDSQEYILKNDKGVMVGDTGIAELKAECQNGEGKFEIIQDVGYSSETSAHLSNDEKQDSPETHYLKNLENGSFLPATGISHHTCTQSTPSKVYLAPDKYPSVSFKTLQFLSEDKPLFNSKYGSCKAVPDSFYKVTSVDDEVFDDSADVPDKADVPSELLSTETLIPNETAKSKVVEVSNEISHLNLESNTNAQSNTEKDANPNKDSFVKLSHPTENNLSPNASSKKSKKSVKPPLNNTSAKEAQPNQHWKKSARVREWLNTCQSADDGTSDDNLDISEKSGRTDRSRKTADSSCDASGEYTTESDSERSNVSDVNNSVSFSQSFTGSIETVVPVVPEENGVVPSDRAGSTEPSPGVRMRKKKQTTRDRPWSVTDVQQTFVSPSVPHSISESALDTLYSAQDSKKIGSRKLDKKRLSLTDVSALSCSSIKSLKINLNIVKGLKSSSPFSERMLLRKKKGQLSDRGSDKCETIRSPVPERENSPKRTASCLNPVPSAIDDKCLKVSEHSSLETSIVSENEKSETATHIEDPGSISWDEYQDPPYLSEPYSEQTADEDEVKKLINFGDDYRAMLGSYSDASSISLKAPPPKIHRTRSKSSWHKGSSQESRDSLMSDSNSDSEDFHHIMKTSKHVLQVVTNTLKENMQKMCLFSSEFAELVATCQTNLCHLHTIHDELVAGCELESLTKEDILKLQDLIKEWEALQQKLLTLSRNEGEQKPKHADLEAATIEVHCSLAALKEKLCAMADNARKAGESTESLSQLKMNVQNLQTGLSNLQEMKESVLSVTARILRLIAEGGGLSITPLRDTATKLYQQWEDVYELNCSELTKLQGLQTRWRESTESEMNSSSETTIQWQPVQAGDSLPKPKVVREDFFHSTAAEVQVAGEHDILFEIETESTKASIQCYIENENEHLKNPLHLLSPPAVKTRSLKEEMKCEEQDESEVCNSKRPSCFWRTLRATVPIPFALVILYCMSSLMEPHCCDQMNNYDFSLFPHLRYWRGPPPV